MNQTAKSADGCGADNGVKFTKLIGRAGGERWYAEVAGLTVEYGWSYRANVRAFCTNHASSCGVYARVWRGNEVTRDEHESLRAPRHYAGASKYVRNFGHLARVRRLAAQWANELLPSSDTGAKR